MAMSNAGNEYFRPFEAVVVEEEERTELLVVDRIGYSSSSGMISIPTAAANSKAEISLTTSKSGAFEFRRLKRPRDLNFFERQFMSYTLDFWLNLMT